MARLKEKPLKVGRENFSLTLKGLSLSREDYLQRLEEIKRYIERGDIYQVNFTVRFDFKLTGSPLGLYERFIKNQEPFTAVLCAKVKRLKYLSRTSDATTLQTLLPDTCSWKA